MRQKRQPPLTENVENQEKLIMISGRYGFYSCSLNVPLLEHKFGNYFQRLFYTSIILDKMRLHLTTIFTWV